jgi:hypothetical protein
MTDEELKLLSLEEKAFIKDFSDRGSLYYLKLYLRLINLEEQKMTETIQQLKEDIALLQMKLQKLEELQRTKSPAEEAFRKVYYRYPDKLDDKYGSAWDIFEKGYNASKVTEVEPSMTNCVLLGNPPDGYVTWNEWYNEMGSKGILHNLKISDISAKEYQQEPEKEQQIKELVRESVKWCEEHPDESVEDYLKPHTPEKTEQLLREAFQKVQQTEEWKETQRKIDSNYDEMVKNPPEFLKFELGQSLTDLIYDWWEDVFTKNSNDDIENCIGRLVYWIEEWLPDFQSSSGSQNVDTELLVDGYNDALTKIKSKLRNKK